MSPHHGCDVAMATQPCCYYSNIIDPLPPRPLSLLLIKTIPSVVRDFIYIFVMWSLASHRARGLNFQTCRSGKIESLRFISLPFQIIDDSAL